MKIWILIFSAALFVGGTCLGVALQPKLSPPAALAAKTPAEPAAGAVRRSPEFSVTRFATELKLSDEQDRELDAILSDSQEEMQALGRVMRAAQDKSRDRIMAILKPDQKSQLDQLLAGEREKRAQADVARQVAAYQKLLQLTEPQAAAFRAALLEARSRRHESYGKPGVDHVALRRTLRDEQTQALKSALSPEQFQRYLDISELERIDR